MRQGVVIHRLQQPLPSLLLQVTDIGQKLVVGKALAPIVLPVGPVHEMHDSDEHPWKALAPILVTLEGIVTDVSDVHPWKAAQPIVVTLVGIVTDFRSTHPLNALSPIVVVLVGIITDVRFEHLVGDE
jgi:hypothetical protein